MAYKYSGSIEIKATKHGAKLASLYDSLVDDIGKELTNRIIEDIEAHIEEGLEHVTPSINMSAMHYESSSDMIIEIFSKKSQRPIKIKDFKDSRLPEGYVVKFATLKFVKEYNSPITRRRSHSLTRNKRNRNRNTRKRHSL